ncbi:MAG: TonB family protein [bacterium]|nr:TonB family protein [bacterium]
MTDLAGSLPSLAPMAQPGVPSGGGPRRAARAVLMVFVAGAINVALLFVASYLINASRAPEQDITVPVGVSLVNLAPPAPPKQEKAREETPPPPAEDKPEVEPDLFQPDLGAGIGDIAIDVNIGGATRDDAAREAIFDSIDLDQAPVAMVQVPPEYPFKAREQNVEGYVAVKFLVRPDGSVGNVNILKAQPAGVFDDAVRRALVRWKFQPGRLGNDAVAAWVTTTLRFDLN